MSHLTSRAAIRQGLLVWLLVALCCAIPHCRMLSTYQEHEIETPLPVLLMNLAIHCKVPKEHTWESFREVVGSLLLRRQLGPDFNKCLLYCMMENMKMFGPDRTTLDPVSSVRHAGPYLENYDQEKMVTCIDQVNLMEFKENARARCDKSAIFLTCFNKGIFRLSWEHLLVEAAERCKKKLGIQSSLETGVIDSFVHRKIPDEVFPECLLHCMMRELGMTDSLNERLLDRDRALERVGYFFEEGDKRKMRECVDQANAFVFHSKFSHCQRAKHFLTCFNRDTTMYTLELMLVEASYDCQGPTKAGLGEAILVVHSIIKRIKPGKKFPNCLLYCMFRVIGMIPDEEYLFNNETSQEYVGYFYEQLDRGKMGECIAKANSLEETKFVKPNCARAKRFLTCFNTPPIYTLQLESAQSDFATIEPEESATNFARLGSNTTNKVEVRNYKLKIR